MITPFPSPRKPILFMLIAMKRMQERGRTLACDLAVEAKPSFNFYWGLRFLVYLLSINRVNLQSDKHFGFLHPN